MTQAKDLLKVRCRGARSHTRIWRLNHCGVCCAQRYGSAYLITSISLSIVSFSLSYVLVSAGVDVASLLEKAIATRAFILCGLAADRAGARLPARRLGSP